MKKIYTLDNLTYGYNINYRKWEFRLGECSILIRCNGSETAHKCARIINGSIKRCSWVDQLARKNIQMVCARD